MDSAWPPRIRTARLTLTAISALDGDALAEIMWQERAHLEPSIFVGDTRAALLARLVELTGAFVDGTLMTYVVRDGETILGCVALKPFPQRASLALSYWLRARHTGQGYASEAAAGLCDAIPGDVARLEIWCHADNLASAAVARRLGFAMTSVVRADDAPLHVWTAARATVQARAAVRRACAAVADVLVDDTGTIYAGSATISLGDVGGQPYVVVVSDVGAETTHDLRASLSHNTTLAVGALSLAEDRLVLRHACPPSAITPETLRLFLHEADRLRDLGTRPGDATLYLSSYFTD